MDLQFEEVNGDNGMLATAPTLITTITTTTFATLNCVAKDKEDWDEALGLQAGSFQH